MVGMMMVFLVYYRLFVISRQPFQRVGESRWEEEPALNPAFVNG